MEYTVAFNDKIIVTTRDLNEVALYQAVAKEAEVLSKKRIAFRLWAGRPKTEFHFFDDVGHCFFRARTDRQKKNMQRVCEAFKLKFTIITKPILQEVANEKS